MKKIHIYWMAAATIVVVFWVIAILYAPGRLVAVRFTIVVPDNYRGPFTIGPPINGNGKKRFGYRFTIHVPQNGIAESPFAQITPQYFRLRVVTESGVPIPTEVMDPPRSSVAFYGGGTGRANDGPQTFHGFIGTAEEFHQFVAFPSEKMIDWELTVNQFYSDRGWKR